MTGVITIFSDLTKEKKKTTTTYGRMLIYLKDYIFPTELQNACLTVVIHVCALLPIFHNFLIVLRIALFPAW